MSKSKLTTKSLSNKELIDIKGDSNSKSLLNIPDSDLKTTQTQNSRSRSATRKTTSRSLSSSSGVKPNTIMSLEDRDIVVIDNIDYKESTNSENTLIILDKPRSQQQASSQWRKSQQRPFEIDLAELLESQWPATAGDLAQALSSHSTGSSTVNNSNSHSQSIATQTSVVCERNRSKNPLSHLGQPKVKKHVNVNNFVTGDNLINLDSDSSSTSGIHEHFISSGAGADSNEHKVASESVLTPAPPPSSDYLTKLNLDIGSMVEVYKENFENVYGVIRWIGYIPCTKILSVGIELEDEKENQTGDDGAINGVRLFKCPPGKALFVQPEQCSPDRRFQNISKTTSQKSTESKRQAADFFGQIECPSIEGSVAPLKIIKLEELNAICGKFKGIQGHYNSCYLDATLFAMFAFTCVFDSLLFRPLQANDIASYEEVQKVLREDIINPLRKNFFVRADRVMKLRQLLEKLSSVTGLTSEEKDPEEFLNSLLAQIMAAEPFLKFNSGQDAFYYQLFVEKDEHLVLPTVQQLFEQSFMASDIKLKEVPSCLIIQMPRFGKNFKMYPRILPSQVLDVTDIIDGSPRQCCVCGKLAELECKECYGFLQFGAGLESTSFCAPCLEKVHSHDKRFNHKPRKLKVPQDFLIMAEHITVPRIFMELFAVVCIETSHYVSFVKCGSGLDAPWCFFDSMADRKGEQNGYNIPEVVSVPNLPLWLSEEGAKELNERYMNDKSLPEHAKRLMCDAYICMYQTDVMMYR